MDYVLTKKMRFQGYSSMTSLKGYDRLDMEKAYDRLEWDFIKSILTRLGFHPKWIDWVMECISIVSYYELINGSLEGKIYPSRGIKRGDLLSPYIFILYVEFLGREYYNLYTITKIPNQRLDLWVKQKTCNKPATREFGMTKGKESKPMKNTLEEANSCEGSQSP